MAITVNLYYTGKDGAARRFAQEMTDPETVLLIDSWADQKALDVHHASPMMGEIAALRDKYDLHMKVERYLTDDAGLPPQDAGFIRQ